jgi:hypothetical protein
LQTLLERNQNPFILFIDPHTFMTTPLLLIISLTAILSNLALPWLVLTGEQNMSVGASNITHGVNPTNGIQVGNATYDNMTATESTNTTATNTTTSSPSVFLQEVIRALQTGDNEEAETLLDGGQAVMSAAPEDARKQFEIGLRVLSGGDISEAIKYFEQANQTLG